MTMMKIARTLAAFSVVATAGWAGGTLAATEVPLSKLARLTHFHGLAVDIANPSRLLLATHHGLFAVDATGMAQKISANTDDFMGFTPHPTAPGVLYASGHPATGGNLGFVVSRDGGVTWSKLSDGIGGSADFHQMDVSKADPQVVYGVYGVLQRSADGGKTWIAVGRAPEGLIAVAASRRDRDTLYAATQDGLLQSADGGRTWRPAHESQRPVATVHVTRGGTLYAYMLGIGLLKADETTLAWQTVNRGFGTDYVVHLAADPHDERKLYAVTLDPRTHAQAIHASGDGGRNWARFGR